jgi:putative ubiquitin-RnfH superfamily antitoxin RatB of RatAB toxin-antitoxin module
MKHAVGKSCTVAYATQARQYLWRVDLAADANIQDAIDAARAQAPQLAVPWDEAPVGVFGEQRERADVPVEGDRIELYRALPRDPRAERRERVRRARQAARRL